MKETFIITAILAAFLLRVATATDEPINEIRLESHCYNEICFTLRITSNGTVEYRGSDFLKTKARRMSRISEADFKKFVRKIDQIGFFHFESQYDRYPLDDSQSTTILTDQQPEIVSVVTPRRTKIVKDYMGAPKGLFELEQLILEVTQVSKWSGAQGTFHDVPYYESFPLNKKVTFRTLLESYREGIGSKRVAGYLLMFINNKGIEFNLEAPRNIDLSKFDGYIVDATGYIKEASRMEHVFVATEIRRVRRYIETGSRGE
jgi:Domain of unknown function (DUF6438)